MAEYLKEFIDGEEILAAETNANNNYLLDQIRDSSSVLNTKMNTLTSNMNSEMATLRSDINSKIDEVNKTVEDFKTEVNARSSAPDYAKSYGISLPYTCKEDGYAFVAINTGDAYLHVRVDGKPVYARRSSQYGGIGATGGGFFRVSKKEVITAEAGVQEAYFYPKKGA